MTRFRIGLLTAVTLAATLPAIAQAQDDRGPRREQRGPDGGDRGARPDRGQGGEARQQRGQAGGAMRADGPGRFGQDRVPQQAQVQPQPQSQPQPTQAQAQPQRNDRSRNFADGARSARQDDRRFGNDRGFDGRRDEGRAGSAGYGAPRAGFATNDRRFDPRVNGDGRQERIGSNWRSDRRYDWRNYREANRGQFRVGRYVAPRGWSYGYRRFSIGFRIDPFLYASSYWIADPYAYRLPPVWGSYRWVRYYDDVLLIDTATGTVVDEIPDFFW